MYDIQQSTTAYELLFLLVLSSDHVSPATGLTPTVTIRKAGGSYGSPAGAVSEIANGWYKVAGNATDTNTLGPLLLHATGTGTDPTDVAYNIVAYNPQDAVRLGITALPNAAAAAAGGLYTRGTGAGQINQDANGRIDVNPVAWKGGTIPTPTVTGEPLVDANHWKGGAIPTPNVTGEPLVDLNHWIGDVPNPLLSGHVQAQTNAGGYSRNVSAAIQFVMEDSFGQPVLLLADGDFTAKQESLDGAAFTTFSGTITEVGNGLYTITLTAGEWDGDLVTFYFTAPGALPRMWSVKTTA